MSKIIDFNTHLLVKKSFACKNGDNLSWLQTAVYEIATDVTFDQGSINVQEVTALHRQTVKAFGFINNQILIL